MHPVLIRIGSFVLPSHGALAALGVVLALALAQRTARRAGLVPAELWNLSILALCAALAGSRLVLLAVSFVAVHLQPAWLFSVAMAHHLILTAVAAAIAGFLVVAFTRRRRISLAATADALAAPLALGLAVEQIGAFFSGADYGTRSPAPWAVTYTDPLALRWSGAPLLTPVHPVQLYAALAWFLLALVLLAITARLHRPGDLAGIFLLAAGAIVYLTEFFRDAEGRGPLFHGALHVPQLAALASVLAGGLVLRERSHRPHLRNQGHAHA